MVVGQILKIVGGSTLKKLIAFAAANVIISEVFKGPLEDATENIVPTNELSARGWITLYKAGTVGEADFRKGLTDLGMKPYQIDVLAVSIAKAIADNDAADLLKVQTALAKEYEKNYDKLVALDVDEAQRELKEMESELDRLNRDSRKIDVDEFSEMAEVDVKEIETEIRILEKQIKV